MGNKVAFGLSKVHYAVITEAAGAITYGTPVPIPGAVTLGLDPQSALTTFWADNVNYYEDETNQGYSGSLEFALLPDSFRKDVLGETADANGVLVESKSAKAKPFALLFEFDGDVNATRHVLYQVHASRPKVASATKKNQNDPQTETLNIRAVPALDTGNVKAKVTSDLTPYETFFQAVYEPVAAAG